MDIGMHGVLAYWNMSTAEIGDFAAWHLNLIYVGDDTNFDVVLVKIQQGVGDIVARDREDANVDFPAQRHARTRTIY